MALMIGALIIQGIQPGPSVISEQLVLLLVLNLPLIGIWVKLISVPYHYLFPMILVFCAIGVYSLHNAGFDILVMSIFGLVGYLLRKLDCEPAPMLLGFALGPMTEENLRRAMLLSRGDPSVY